MHSSLKIMAAGLLVLGLSVTSQAKEKQTKENLSTDISFEDLLVKGKYHFSDEAVTTVEDDKVLDALLGIRKDFKDRVRRSASRY